MTDAPDPRDLILRAAGRSFGWSDVLAAAYFRGDAGSLHERVSDSIAALRYAEEEGFPLAFATEAAVEEFRNEHLLITGEEMDDWLAHCALRLEEIEACCAGLAFAERFEERMTEIRRDYAPSSAEVMDALWPCTMILPGAFDELTLGLARRLANFVASENRVGAEARQLLLREGRARVPEALVRPGLIEDLAGMEVLYAEAQERVAPPGRCAREIAERSYQLTRIVVGEVLFSSLDRANEAYQCLRVDGMDLAELAEAAGAELVEHTLFADEAPSGALPLLSATPGAAVEPEKAETGFVLRVLRERIEPDPSDPSIRERVRERLLAAHFDALVSLHVTRSFDPWLSS